MKLELLGNQIKSMLLTKSINEILVLH